MTDTAVWLLALLLFGHFLGDFTGISTKKMLEAKETGRAPGWIFVHAGVHGLLVGLAVFAVVRPSLIVLGLAVAIEWGTHFLIDLTRTRTGLRWPQLRDMGKKPFWISLGLDQLAHGLVLLWVAALVL